jgi:hypothetical protein
MPEIVSQRVWLIIHEVEKQKDEKLAEISKKLYLEYIAKRLGIKAAVLIREERDIYVYIRGNEIENGLREKSAEFQGVQSRYDFAIKRMRDMVADFELRIAIGEDAEYRELLDKLAEIGKM